jgi:phosphohistidine phosphatase
MKLYLARHGEYATNDIKAPLSSKGIEDVQRLADFLASLEIHVANIFHSEKLRAQQTAELLAKGFVSAQPAQIRQGLNPNDDVAVFAHEITGWDDDMLVVGHLPFMSRLTGKLVANDEYKELIAFQPGTIVCLENIQVDRWMIDWVVNPSLLTK